MQRSKLRPLLINLKIMKKTILITVLLLAASFNMQAQLFKLGIKAGLNYANQNGSQITINNSNYTTSAITSYHAGLIAEIKLINSFSVQPELLYSRKEPITKMQLKNLIMNWDISPCQ